MIRLGIVGCGNMTGQHLDSFTQLKSVLRVSAVCDLNRERAERAKELLADGTHTVSEVAYACGFENVGYFCRYYRDTVGEAPGETRKKNGGS